MKIGTKKYGALIEGFRAGQTRGLTCVVWVKRPRVNRLRYFYPRLYLDGLRPVFEIG